MCFFLEILFCFVFVSLLCIFGCDPGSMSKHGQEKKYACAVVPSWRFSFVSCFSSFLIFGCDPGRESGKCLFPPTCQHPQPRLFLNICQRHSGPESSQSNFFCHITSSYTKILIKSHLHYLDQASTSKSQPNISITTKFQVKILTKPSFRILTKIQLHNLSQTSSAKYWPNFSFKISPNYNFKILTKVWTKVKHYYQISASKSATNCRQHDPHHQQ